MSPPSHTPHFSFPFSAAAKESGKAHSKTKSAPSASGDAKDRAPQGKAKMGRKRARLVSFISRLGGAQAHATASGTDTPTSPSVPSSTSTVNGEPGAPRSPASSIGPGLVPLAVDLESGPTSPVSASGSVPGSPVSFIAYGWGGGSVPSSPSVPAFPRFDDSGVSVLKEKEGKMGKVRARASTLNVGGGTGGMGFAAIVGMGVARGTRRRLVVRGIGAEDVRAYEAVRAWCEVGSFCHCARRWLTRLWRRVSGRYAT